MSLLDFLAAAAVAVLSGMGVGSGGLFVVYLTLVRGAPQADAQAVNLVFFIFASGAALILHLKKRKIDIIALLAVIISGIPFAYLGSYISGMTGNGILRFCFGVFLLVSAGAVLIGEAKKSRQKGRRRKNEEE